MKKFLLAASILCAFNANASQGYYIKGELGAGMAARFDNRDYGGMKPMPGSILGVALGRDFNNNIGADLSFHRFNNFKFNHDHEGERKIQNFGSNVFSANLNYTFKQHKIIQPFVTGGAGFALLETGTMKYTDGVEHVQILAKSQYNFIWNAGFGANIKTNLPFDISLSYRFYDLGKSKSSNNYIISGIGAGIGEPAETKFRVHAITAGIKYNF